MRCDLQWVIFLVIIIGFNPHTYMRCDIGSGLDTYTRYQFQSTHLHEVWRRTLTIMSSYPSFNPHTYMRCDLRYAPSFLLCWSFNPHTYMRCDLRFRKHRHQTFKCFNPHTYMRCDQRWGVLMSRRLSFNPHTYMRCDGLDCTYCPYLAVSIHTPTWGVTLRALFSLAADVFQSTHLHEVWRCPSCCWCPWGWFQSTHLHEVWRY